MSTILKLHTDLPDDITMLKQPDGLPMLECGDAWFYVQHAGPRSWVIWPSHPIVDALEPVFLAECDTMREVAALITGYRDGLHAAECVRAFDDKALRESLNRAAAVLRQLADTLTRFAEGRPVRE
jgi:hypothetical protein